MPKCIKDRFESFLCERNDDIDNDSYQLAVAIVKDDPNNTPAEAALELLTCLKFGNTDIPGNHHIINLLVNRAESILMKQGRYDPKRSKVDADVADEDALEWDMAYIGEITDYAESLLVENGFNTCHPYYGGEEGETMCIYCNDCPNTCGFKTADDYEEGKSDPDRD